MLCGAYAPHVVTPTPTRLALFDLDNTLVDRQSVFEQWVCEFVQRHQLGPDAFEVIRAADRDGFATREAVFREVVARFDIDTSVEELVRLYRREYPELYRPDKSVLAALGRLRADGWRLGVVTNGPRTQHEKIRRTGISNLVDGCCVSSEVGAAKPDARIFAEAVRRCTNGASSPLGTWMIGDAADTDIAGGLGCGMRTIWMRRGRVWTNTEFQPNLVADSLDDAVALLLASSES
jgi:HAD superfamily hydrolase (TIGR01549 family)